METFCSTTCSTDNPFASDSTTCSTHSAWDPLQPYSLNIQPIYMIHQLTDLPPNERPGTGGLPTSTKIAVAVVIPVVALLALVLGVYIILKRRKRRRKLKEAKPSAGREISDADVRDLRTELEATDRFELHDAPRPPELSNERAIQEADASAARNAELDDTRRNELHDTSRAEMGSLTRCPLETPPPLYPGSPGPAGAGSSRADDNDPFEMYPVPIGSPVTVLPPEDARVSERLTSLQSASERLDERIRRVQLDGLKEQKRRIDEQISSLSAKQ